MASPETVAAWHRRTISAWQTCFTVLPHSACQRGKVDPSDWWLDGTAWDYVLRPAILRRPEGATP